MNTPLQSFLDIKEEMENILSDNKSGTFQFSNFPDREHVYIPDNYEILQILWRTLYGCALIAYDFYEKKTVIIKVNSIDTSKYSKNNSIVFNDYLSECLILKHLLCVHSDESPNKLCVELIDEIKTKDWHISIIEQPEKGNLYKFIIKHNGISNYLSILKKMCLQLIEGVYDFHKNKNLAHFDINPHNIYITKNLDLKITDFNQSLLSFSKHTGPVVMKVSDDDKVFTCKLFKKDIFPGLPMYVSPEVFANETFDAYANDVWSLGIVLFFILAGKTPFKLPTKNCKKFMYFYTGEWIEDKCEKTPWFKNIYRVHESIFRVINQMLKPENERLKICEVKEMLTD